LVVVKG